MSSDNNMTNDKESYVCLNCYAVGSLTINGRCSTCDSDAVASAETIQQIAETSKRRIEESNAVRAKKPLRWWHFVCGPFETFISNYRVKDVEEAHNYVLHDGYEWSVTKATQRIGLCLQDLDNMIYGVKVEDISNDEFDALLTAKHRRGVGTPLHLVDEQEKAQENNTMQTTENKTT